VAGQQVVRTAQGEAHGVEDCPVRDDVVGEHSLELKRVEMPQPDGGEDLLEGLQCPGLV
jgi:hypothetical protein